MAGLGKAVQQHDGIAPAGDEIMQIDAVDLGEFALRALRQGRTGSEQCDRESHRYGEDYGTTNFQRALHARFPHSSLKQISVIARYRPRYLESFGQTGRTSLRRRSTSPSPPADHSPR